MKARLVLELSYSLENGGDPSPEEIEANLQSLVDFGADNGLFSGEGELIVDEWSARVEFPEERA